MVFCLVLVYLYLKINVLFHKQLASQKVGTNSGQKCVDCWSKILPSAKGGHVGSVIDPAVFLAKLFFVAFMGLKSSFCPLCLVIFSVVV